ncbi:hypothetical protein CSB37_00440 [bacterium DOLZORAL124_38_8]|nr:MAG: hypothetical protein CSB37_00440 [bacterium DOLZORAL124_38_8]
MKKFLVFALSVLASTSAFAQFITPNPGDDIVQSDFVQDTKSEYNYTFTVLNISKDNVDATQNQPRIGDMLLFKINLSGKQPIADEAVMVNVAGLKDAVSFTEVTPGEVKGNNLEFPKLNKSADLWEEEYGFYVRVNDTKTEKLSATYKDTTLEIPLNLSRETRCKDCEVPKTGPAQLYVWILAAVAFFVGIIGLKSFKRG